jgi:hypothetical protein
MARPTSGSQLVNDLSGSEQARKWARLVLATIANEEAVVDAAKELGVSRQYFHERRTEILLAMVAAAEPKPVGRRKAVPSVEERTQQQLAALDQQLNDMAMELEGARLREELRVVFGNRLPKYGSDEGRTKKNDQPQG